MLLTRCSCISSGTLSMSGVPIVPGAMAHTRMPERREVAGHRQGHAEDGGLRRRVGELAGLALDAGDRRGVHDHAPLAVVVGLVGRHRGRGEAGDVEGAEGVHLHRADEGVLVVGRAVAADRAPAADAAAGDVDHERERRRASAAASMAAPTSSSSLTSPPTATAASPSSSASARGPVAVAVEDGHAAAELDQAAHGRGAQPAGAAGHQCRSSVRIHVLLSLPRLAAGGGQRRPVLDPHEPGEVAAHDLARRRRRAGPSGRWST